MALSSLAGLPVEMGWRHVLFASWPVEPSVVEAHLPNDLEADTYDGQAWLSVVPFTNATVKPRGLPDALGFGLPELNLRTYVTCDGVPGVYFFSLDAEGVLGVAGARLFHHLPYYYARISLQGVSGRVHFESKRLHPGERPAHFTATYGPVGDRLDVEAGSRAEFLTARYRYFTQDPNERVRVADIEHERWPLYEAEADIDVNTLFTADGFAHPGGDPVLHYSPGVDVTATGSRRWG